MKIIIMLLTFTMMTVGCSNETAETIVIHPYNVENTELIAHALGTPKDGEQYTNSLEAFTHSYEQGFRMFEVDIKFHFNDYILDHGWEGLDEELKNYDIETYLNTKRYDKYQNMTLETMLNLMTIYDDVIMITDYKSGNFSDLSPHLELMFNTYDVKDRVIPQIYEIDNWGNDKATGYSEFWYTVYREDDIHKNPESLFEFMKNPEITTNVRPHMSVSDFDEWTSDEFNTVLHTVNNMSNIEIYDKTNKIYGIMTDYSIGDMLRHEKY